MNNERQELIAVLCETRTLLAQPENDFLLSWWERLKKFLECKMRACDRRL
jgi:hypothetical protein